MLWFLPHNLRRNCYRSFRSTRYRKLLAIRESLAPMLRHNCLFIHIPKSAGVAVSTGLFGDRTSSHATILDYALAFDEREFDSLFKFTFVRNPWDRLVSAYLFLKQGGVHASDQLWSDRHLSSYGDFEHFVKGWVRKGNVEASLHFRPQVRFLCRPFSLRPLVDFVGYFENLPNDFASVAERLGINGTLAKLNETANKRNDYKGYYSATTRDIVSEVYRDDIAVFGYNFDNAVLDRALQTRRSMPGGTGATQI
jgi:hypothetical protein